jgi:murein DD-endopeptidase MepM/ murein hydrolase activator NlpD
MLPHDGSRFRAVSQPRRYAYTLALAAVALLIKDSSALPAASGNTPFTLLQSIVYPVMGPRESSSFGLRTHPVRGGKRHHAGVDLAAPAGSPIRAIAAGRVMFADPFGTYGKFVVIEHAHGITSHYGHCKTLTVAVGQVVQAGHVIGTVGSTGGSTGPHLHFEIRRDGKPQHPERFLPGLDSPTKG